jgi:protein-tyrosine kinase
MSRVYRALQKAEREREEKPKKEHPIEELRTEELRTQEVRTEEQRVEEQRTEEQRTEEQPRTTVIEKIVARIGEGTLRYPRIKVEPHELPPGDEPSVLTVPPDSFAAEQFRKLKTQIFHVSPNPPHIILVTSATPNEGKSMVSFNLALSISQEIQKKAILVDADLRKPSVLFKKHTATRGLSNYLSARIPLAEILIRLEENFWIVPAGPSSRKSSELIGTRRMTELLVSLREFGDENFIIIDSPPILLATDPVLLSKMVDGIIMVVMADRTPKESVRRAIHSVDRNKIIGVVLNQVEKESSSYYGKYYHKYYQK